MKEKGCTFFGHRDCPALVKPKLRELLVKLIEQQGVKVFYVGNHGAFDAMAIAVLRELALEYPEISYTVVLAYMPGKSKEENICTLLPEGIEKVPRRFAICWRNRWMLKHTDYVVTYVAHSWGGAAKFANEAQKQGKTVYNLWTGEATINR